jgi:PAT family beta-lactamase induction signal transducer AmpG
MRLAPKLGVIALVYVIEGYPMGVHNLWSVYFRRHEVSLTELGVLSILSLAWSLKFLWSPLVDRFGERRQWIAGSLLVMTACLVAIAGSEPRPLGIALWAALALFCLGSATQDVAIDAYTIGLVEPGEEGLANSVRIIAYRVGMSVLAGTALFFLPARLGWPATFLVAAALSAAMAASALACPRVEVPPESRREFWQPLRRWLGRRGALPVLAFVLLYRVGDRAMGPMLAPLWVDRGFAEAEIGVATGTLGMLATVGGAAAGGALVSWVGIGAALWWLGGLALGSNLAYAGVAAHPEWGRAGMYAGALAEHFCSGLASAAFLSFLMRICQKEHAAVQYALLTALYALTGSLVAMPSGWIAERIGYAGYFGLTAAYALPAFACLPGAAAWLAAAPVRGATPREPRPDSPPRSGSAAAAPRPPPPRDGGGSPG